MTLIIHVLLNGLQRRIALTRAPQTHMVDTQFDAEELHKTLKIADVLVIGYEKAMLLSHVFHFALKRIAFELAEKARIQANSF